MELSPGFEYLRTLTEGPGLCLEMPRFPNRAGLAKPDIYYYLLRKQVKLLAGLSSRTDQSC